MVVWRPERAIRRRQPFKSTQQPVILIAPGQILGPCSVTEPGMWRLQLVHAQNAPRSGRKLGHVQATRGDCCREGWAAPSTDQRPRPERIISMACGWIPWPGDSVLITSPTRRTLGADAAVSTAQTPQSRLWGEDAREGALHRPRERRRCLTVWLWCFPGLLGEARDRRDGRVGRVGPQHRTRGAAVRRIERRLGVASPTPGRGPSVVGLKVHTLATGRITLRRSFGGLVLG